jgi:class 3 adenylate cyclase
LIKALASEIGFGCRSLSFRGPSEIQRHSERYGPNVEPYLTAFLILATEAIAREEGTVDKFIGDAVIAFGNAPGE